MRRYQAIFNKKGFLLAALCCIVYTSKAQYVYDYKKSADMYYAKADYYSAAVYYEKYLETKGGGGTNAASTEPYSISDKSKTKKGNAANVADKGNIQIKLAESYRLINDYGNAEKWYAEALKSSDNINAVYWYAVSLRANGKFNEAKQQFEKYIGSKSQEKQFNDQAKKELLNTQFAIEQKNKKDLDTYTITKVNGLNSEGANYASSLGGNAIIFTSTRPDTDKEEKNKIYKNTLYTATANGLDFTSATKLNITTAKEMEQGVASVNSTGNKLYITRWIKVGKENKAAIYISENRGGEWSEPVKLNEQVNVEGFNAQQPFITADDKYLIFSSNRPGGSGKFDLWYSELNEEGLPVNAVNLGNSINTEEDEQAPFYHQLSNTLVFSSKGKIGLGGFDFFTSQGILGSGFSEAENMGYPVNSSKDDLYFTNKPNSALLSNAIISSDRASQCCLELFTLNRAEPKVIEKQPEIVVVEKPQPKKNTEQKVYFDFDKYTLQDETVIVLNRLANLLKTQEDLGLEIFGYTDNKGSDEYNLKLSQARANACKDFLVKAGIAESRIKTEGKGKSIPSGEDAKDRKVEFRMLLLN